MIYRTKVPLGIPFKETKGMVQSFLRLSFCRLRGMGLGYVEILLDKTLQQHPITLSACHASLPKKSWAWHQRRGGSALLVGWVSVLGPRHTHLDPKPWTNP